MKTNVADPSLEAYRDGFHAGLWGKQSEEVRQAVQDSKKPITRLEVSKKTGIAINAVSGRCNLLVKIGAIKDIGAVKCSISGRMVGGLTV